MFYSLCSISDSRKELEESIDTKRVSLTGLRLKYTSSDALKVNGSARKIAAAKAKQVKYKISAVYVH